MTEKEQGDEYYEYDEYDEAIAEYTKAIRLDPNDASAYYERANAYYENGEYAEAIADYSEITRIDPDNFIAYCKRASAYEEKGDYDKAIADYTEAVRLILNPDVADDRSVYEVLWDVQVEASDIYEARAQVHIKKKDFEPAILDLGKALKLEPGNEVIRKKLRKTEKSWLEGAKPGKRSRAKT